MPLPPASPRGIPRREFLRRGACAATTLAVAPTLIPASALGLNGAVSPSNRIVMGFIGVGGQGTQGMAGGIWAPEGGFIGRKEVQAVAVADVNARNRERARGIINQKNGTPDCAAYTYFEELLARKDIDACLTATGDRWHPHICMAAARAGKDIYCEKPLSLTIEEAIAARETVRRYGTIVQVGTQQRSSHAFRHACELVRNGYLGELREVVVAVGGPVAYRDCHLPAEPEPDWLEYNRWLGPAPWRPFNSAYVGGWMAFRDFSGGEMTNWGAHHFDVAQWGLGMDQSGPVEILPPNGKDIPVLTYRYANDTLLSHDPDRMARECGQNNGVMFFGTQGKLAVWRYDLKSWPDHIARQKIGPNEIRLHSCDNHHTDFVNAIRSRGRPGADIAINSRSITVCHLGNIAYELGRPVRWDPARERFIDDPQADRLLGRALRAPWHL